MRMMIRIAVAAVALVVVLGTFAMARAAKHLSCATSSPNAPAVIGPYSAAIPGAARQDGVPLRPAAA